MTAYKRAGSPYWLIDFQFLGQHVRRSSSTTSKTEAEALEQKWRQQISDRAKLDKVLSETAATVGGWPSDAYDIVLADLKAKRAQIDQAIAAIKSILWHRETTRGMLHQSRNP